MALLQNRYRSYVPSFSKVGFVQNIIHSLSLLIAPWETLTTSYLMLLGKYAYSKLETFLNSLSYKKQYSVIICENFNSLGKSYLTKLVSFTSTPTNFDMDISFIK
uniref:Uncharacterized protein n=1 Tax=Cacopsylla melanoneura TaxID=428564 RepID=A0A8D9AKJ9_9HEMI